MPERFTPAQLDKLRTPIDWRDIPNENPIVTKRKVERAHELNKDRPRVIAVLFDADEVLQRVLQLATLEHAVQNGNIDDSVYASFLRGAVPFTAPFFGRMAALSPVMNPVVDYLHASRYGKSQRGTGLKIYRKLGPDTDFAGKRFVAVEDTIDEGITIDRVARTARHKTLCRRLGQGVTGPAAEIAVVSLTDKRIANLQEVDETNVTRGFWIPNGWAGGNGLDGPEESMRWIPELVLTATQDEKYREEMPEILEVLGERAILGMDDINWIQKAA